MSLRDRIFRFLRKGLSRGRADVAVRLRGPTPVCNQRVLLCGAGQVTLGENVTFGWRQSPCFEFTHAYVEARFPRSEISIGRDCVFSNDVAVVAEGGNATGSVVIGERCVFGIGFRCYDSDFHGLEAAHRNDRSRIRTARVVIGDDCFFGERCMVLKGVTLGNRCVVGAGSVVTKSFPDDSLIAGNPARLIRKIDQGESPGGSLS